MKCHYISIISKISILSSGFWSEQIASKKNQDQGNNGGGFFLSAVCVITADVWGSVRAQAKEEGEKCRQLNGMCKQESFHDSQPPYVLQSVGTTRLCTVLVVFRYSFPLAAFSPPCIDRRDRKWRCGEFSSSLQTHGNIWPSSVAPDVGLSATLFRSQRY